MKWKVNIRKEIKVTVALLMVLGLIAFSENKRGDAVCQQIVVELDNIYENHFIDEAEILKLVESAGHVVIGKSINQINLKAIEQNLKLDRHILNAELFGDLKGNLVVSVELRRPIARIVQPDAADAYIAEDGVIMPVSDTYTSRVVLVSGGLVRKLIESQNLNSTEEGKKILEMIEFVNRDRFWKAQVAQLDINPAGEVTIYPQITSQRIEFGKAEQIEIKFRKLMIFYKEILPQRGWTKYERISLEYEGQIIAE